MPLRWRAPKLSHVSFLVQETTTPEADCVGETIYQQSAAGINWASVLQWKSAVEMPPDKARNILTFVSGILVFLGELRNLFRIREFERAPNQSRQSIQPVDGF